MISKVIPSATSLQASADGPTRSGSQDGPMIDRSGRGVVRVNPSRHWDIDEVLPTPGTFGRSNIGSSKSVVLQHFLESRLRERNFGSVVCVLTWKPWTTVYQQRFCQLFASTRNTDATDFTILPTPTKRDGRTLLGSRPPKRSPTAGLPLAWFLAKRLNIFLGRLNPIKVGYVMGYPERVSRLAPTATRSSRKSRQSSSKPQPRP